MTSPNKSSKCRAKGGVKNCHAVDCPEKNAFFVGSSKKLRTTLKKANLQESDSVSTKSNEPTGANFTENELRIYRKYRHYLTAQRTGYTRAAARRQQARALTVESFNIPFAEVKRIVAAGDLQNEISHEAPKGYNAYADLKFKRIPISQVQVGDRVIYANGRDAQVTAIDGSKISFKGIYGFSSKDEVSTWQTNYESENGSDFTISVVVSHELHGNVSIDE